MHHLWEKAQKAGFTNNQLDELGRDLKKFEEQEAELLARAKFHAEKGPSPGSDDEELNSVNYNHEHSEEVLIWLVCFIPFCVRVVLWFV